MDGVLSAAKLAEVANEWQIPHYVAKRDLWKAFCRMRHEPIRNMSVDGGCRCVCSGRLVAANPMHTYTGREQLRSDSDLF